MTIDEWLRQSTDELADLMFTSPRLDAEIILAHTIRQPRTWLHAHGDEALDVRSIDVANARLELRKDHVPVAYIIGHKDFYGRQFVVSPAVLIPRPESEQLIEMLRKLLPNTAPLPGIDRKRLVDIGTGSGCLGITAKLEFPELDVTLLDNDRHVKTIVEKNIARLVAEVTFMPSDLLASYPYTPDIVLANLPYVDKTWDYISRDVEHEPAHALYASDDGLAVIKRCIEQCEHRLIKDGLLLLEADTKQLDAIQAYANEHGFVDVARTDFAIGLQHR